MIRTLKAKGYTIVMVEQNFRFAAPLADRFYVMEHGTIVESFAAVRNCARRRRRCTSFLGFDHTRREEM